MVTAEPRRLRSFTSSVLARIWPRQFIDEVHLMNRPGEGWASFSYPWTWAELARIPDWRLGGPYGDEHSTGFWLHYARRHQQR